MACSLGYCGNVFSGKVLKDGIFFKQLFSFSKGVCRLHTVDNKSVTCEEDVEFRTLELYKKKSTVSRQAKLKEQKPPMTPRYTQMPVDQDWTNVWPTAQTFKASVVPLPLRMGYVEKGAPPGKYGNAELMKIPNFLHLTPPAIKKHCAAISKFCTEWPPALNSDDVIEQNFPVTITTSDYCYSGPSIRNPSSRIVTLQLKLSSIELDEHAKDKLLRLVGERYDVKTDSLTLVTDRCPVRKQNYDYALYLLTALFHESWKIEHWENEKELLDMEKYLWDGSKSQSVVLQLMKDMKYADQGGMATSIRMSESIDDVNDDVVHSKDVTIYGETVTRLHNDGEDAYTLNMYKNSVRNILHLILQGNDTVAN